MNKKIFSENYNLSSYTTIKVGGVAEYFAEPRSIKEFLYLVKLSLIHISSPRDDPLSRMPSSA